MRELIVGSRGSPLALAQTREILEQLKNRFPQLSCRIQVIHTTADKRQDVPLSHMGQSGVFVKEIEHALLKGSIDFAVHSAKDLPSEMVQELCIAAYPVRLNPADVLVSRVGPLSAAPAGSRVGTSSVRRRALLLAFRRDLVPLSIRGNLDTRIKKLNRDDCDALVLAYAGLARLGLTSFVTEILDPNVWLPAVGQGAVAVQCRADDDIRHLIAELDDSATRACVTAERAFLKVLRAGCLAPVGALAAVHGSTLRLDGLIAALDGSRVFRYSEVGSLFDPESLGARLAERFLASPAADLLHESSGKSMLSKNGREDLSRRDN
jgi:hydroxymethylbilane synthase